jgi:uncharacterized integral membrane protein (TIGR00698 family)
MIQKKHLPGLVFAALVTIVAFTTESLIKNLTPIVISPLVVAVVIGAVLQNFEAIPGSCDLGLRFAARNLLRLGIVLLGLQLSLDQIREVGAPGLVLVVSVVAITFFGTQWLGKRLGLSKGLSLLVATGFSICGASAIVAMRPVSDADDDEVAYAIGLVTICGTLAIFSLPLIAKIIDFNGAQFGSWVGASVHDVAQTVATAASGDQQSQTAAIIVKLTRVMLLAPMVAGVSLVRRRQMASRHNSLDQHGVAVAKLPPIVPLFVVGFLGAIFLNSLVAIPQSVQNDVKWVEKSLLASALVGLGAGVDIGRLRKIGNRPLILGLISWLLIATLSAIGVALLY